jgi:outer membrane biosynthesis protein TonB
MEQTETAFSIGEVIDALGVKLPTIDETPAAPEADQEAVADETPTDNTPEDQPEDADPAESTEDSSDPSDSTEQPEDATEEDADEEPAEEDPESAEAPAVKKLAKRVDKLTARAKSAEEQATSLQAELAAAKDALTRAQPIVLQDAADPLADVTSAEALESRLAAANTVLDNVPDLIAKAEYEGGEVEVDVGNGSTRKFTKQELQERLRVARQILKAEPARRNYLAQRESFQHEARQVYPELFQEESQARQMMMATLQAYPGIAKLPNLELIIGDAIRGQALRFQQAEAIQKKATTTKAKPAAPAAAKPAVAPKVVSPSAAPKTKSQADPLEALKKSGNRDAAENFVASLFN